MTIRLYFIYCRDFRVHVDPIYGNCYVFNYDARFNKTSRAGPVFGKCVAVFLCMLPLVFGFYEHESGTVQCSPFCLQKLKIKSDWVRLAVRLSLVAVPESHASAKLILNFSISGTPTFQ